MIRLSTVVIYLHLYTRTRRYLKSYLRFSMHDYITLNVCTSDSIISTFVEGLYMNAENNKFYSCTCMHMWESKILV